MKRSLRIAVLLLLFLVRGIQAQQQPRIRYIAPDVGTPGMNTYVEVFAPAGIIGGFGNADGLYNAPAIEVRCVNPADTAKLVISPCVISWEGRLVTCQIFVRPSVTVGSTPIAVPIQVVRTGNNQTFSSNVDTFFIVQPQSFGTKSGGGMIGSGGSMGTRSKRGAMIVDSMVLGSGTYTIDTTDTDPLVAGNQGFLPFIVLSRGRIVVNSDATISASAYGKNGGPGGGGGGGYGASRAAVAFPPAPAIPGEADAPLGSGFVGGRSAIPLLGSPGGFGSSSGPNDSSLSGVGIPPFNATGRWYSAGTGHPFDDGGRAGGAATITSTGATPPWAWQAIGGGGNATSSTGTGNTVVQGGDVGNQQIVPLHGGGGGAGGGPCDSVGGGGGGGMALYANLGAVVATAHSRGGRGRNGSTFNGTNCTGTPPRGDPAAGGAGGSIIIGGKLGVRIGTIDVSGGIPGTRVSTSNAMADTGGAGRFRNDGRFTGSVTVTAAASRYTGPTTDTLTYADSTRWTLRGTGRAGDSILVYVRGENSGWNFTSPFRAGVQSDSTWQTRITFPFDSVAYVVAIQRCSVPSSMNSYARVPAYAFSQSAANVVRLNLFPSMDAPAARSLETIVCPVVRRDTVRVRNRGTGPLILKSGSGFTGGNTSLYSLVSPTLPDTVEPGDSVDVIYTFNGTATAAGQLNTTLRLLTNDPAPGRSSFDITITAYKEARRFAIREARINIGGAYVGTPVDTSAFYINLNTFRDTISSVSVVSGPPVLLLQGPTTPATTAPGDSTRIRFRIMARDTGAFTVILKVTTQPCNRDTVIIITGYGRSGVIASQKGWPVTGQNCNDTAVGTYGVRNVGNAPLTVDYPTFDPAGDPGFTILSPPQSSFPITIQPGDSIPFRIQVINPSGALLLSRLRFTSSDSLAGKNPHNVDVSSEREQLSLAPVENELDLGILCIGEPPAYKEARLNNGAQRTTARIISIARTDSSAPFTIATPGSSQLPLDVGPREQTVIGVRFAPTVPGVFIDTLLVRSDPCDRIFRIVVRGTAVSSTLAGDASAISFGDVRVGTAAQKTIILKNESITGTSVTIDQLRLNPQDPQLRILWPTIPPDRTLAPGDTIRVTIEYRPAAAGALQPVTLCARISAPCPGELCRPVDGNGIISSIAASRGALDLVAPACGGSAEAEDTLSLVNLGNTVVNVTGITATPGAFTVVGATSFPLTAGERRTVRVRFTAPGTGVVTGSLSIATTDPQRPTITIGLTGRRDTARVTLSAHRLDFDTVYSCALPARRSIRIVNDGTLPDTIRAAVLPAPFELSPPPPYIIAAGRDTTVTLLFNPGADGRFTARGTISGGPCGISDTILVEGVRATPAYAVDPLDFGDVPVGTLATGYAVVRNPTSQTIRISSAMVTPSTPSLNVAPGQFPLRVPPYGTANLALLFTPGAPGPIPTGTTLEVTMDSLCSTRISSNVAGQGVEGSLIATRNAFFFGNVLFCREGLDSVTVRNAGTAPMTVQGASIDPPLAELTLSAGAGMPKPLAPGDSIVFRVRFAPVAGPDGRRTATLRIATDDPKRPEIDVQLRGERISHAIAFGGVTFAPTPIGSSDVRTGALVNTGTAPISLTGLSLPAPFRIVRTIPSPAGTLRPGDTLRVELEFAPTGAATFTDSLGAEATGLCEPLAKFGVTGTGTSALAATASWPDISGSPGQTVSIPLRLESDVSEAGITSYTIGATFNRTLLLPTGIVLAGTLSDGWTVSSRSLEPGSVEFTATGTRPLAGPGTLAVVEARVLLGDSVETAIMPSSESRFLSDRATLKIAAGAFRLEEYCVTGGDRLVRDGGMFGLRSVSPNPVSGEASVEIGIVEHGRTRLSLADAAGRRAAVLVDRELAPGTYRFILSTAGIPSGVYLLELVTPTARQSVAVTIAH